MENGEDVYLGDIAIDRWTDGRVLTVSADVQAEEEERYAERNIRRMVGDPNIVWHLGGMSQNASLKIPYASTY
jgi:calcineurin-like phosphoesterase family protein